MVALTYIKSIRLVLVTASVFAIAFGCIVALLTPASYQDIFSITAAYVAVLVIFVGTAIST
jgi:hypothetical protein